MEPRPRSVEDSDGDLELLRAATGYAEEPHVETLSPPSNCPWNRPLGHTDVFVDDFIQVGQGGEKRMYALRNHLLHAVDDILDKPLPDETHRREAISLKKLLQGDGSWATRKVLLGWILDTVRQTLEIPPHRKATLAQIFSELQSTKRVSEKNWQRILGKLRFVSQAIPGSGGLFCALQLALNRSSQGRIHI